MGTMSRLQESSNEDLVYNVFVSNVLCYGGQKKKKDKNQISEGELKGLIH